MGAMTALVLAMILCLGLGLAVVGVVAVPARREGREVLTAKGEKVVERVKECTETVAAVTKGRTDRLRNAWRHKASAVTSREKASELTPQE